MNKFNLYIDIEDKRWSKAIARLRLKAKACQKAVLEVVQKEVCFLSEPKDFEVNVALSNDAKVHELNLRFRGMDKPTNVLSFANADDDFFKTTLEQEDAIELGDIILAFETMVVESENLNVSFEEHFCHLLVHGLLHILGYDHIKEEDRVKMEQREIEILKKLGFENPYAE